MKTTTLKILLLTAALLLAGFLGFAQDKKISQLPALPSVSGNEAIPLAISGTNYYLTPSQLKSWLNIVGYVPLTGTTNSAPITGNLYFNQANSYLTTHYYTSDTSLFSLNNRLGISSARIESHTTKGRFSQVNITAGHQNQLACFGVLYQTIFLQDTTSVLFTSTYPGFKGGQYESNTCDYINSNHDTSSIIHEGLIQRLISASTPTLSTLTNGYGISGSSYNGSVARTWLVDSTILSSKLFTAASYQTKLTGTGFPYSTGGTISYTTSIPNSSLANNTVSGIALGGTLSNLTGGYGINTFTYTGGAAKTVVVDTTAIASKLYVTAKTGSFITNTVTTLSSLSTVGTLTAGAVPTSLITGTLSATHGGTGINSSATFPPSGVIVTESATETLSNKTLDTSNTLPVGGFIPSWNGQYRLPEPIYGATSTAAGFQTAIYFQPYIVGNTHQINGFASSITIAVAGGQMRYGIYDDSIAHPWHLIDTITVTATTTGAKIGLLSSSHTLLASQMYWIAIQPSSSTISTQYFATSPVIVRTDITNIATSDCVFFTRAYGAFPATVHQQNLSANNSKPYMLVRRK